FAANVHGISPDGFHVFDADASPATLEVPPPLSQSGGPFQILCRQAGEPLRRRPISLVHVLLHHSARVEDRAAGAHGAFHHAQPTTRQTVARSVVKRGHNLLFQQVVYRSAFDVVLICEVRVLFAGANGPAVVARVTFDPPAVEDTEVQSPIGANFHAAGSRC